jgi:TolB-like protein/class 3 adenylate cyclase
MAGDIAIERKLAAILAADVVGYAALMERDEKGTHERLIAGRKELFEPEIARHHGRVFKLMGDGMLAEFGSVVDAVECAVSLQRGLAERNANVPEDRRIQVRIGINLGEVIVEGDDRYGEGVNIAARLEQIADPGGICVSGKVAKEVEKKLAFGFEPMGAQQVKNIAEPIQAFRVRLDRIAALPGSTGRKASPRFIAALIGLLALLIAGAGAWYGLKPPAPVAREPSIAVLPFANMSGDPAQDYLGSGIAEDIITILSSYPTLRVVSRTSSFVYDKPVKVQQVGQDLKVNYVIEGSVRKAGGKVRVTAQLIDAVTGDHVWADRYDEEGSDVAALQDDVANRIYNTIAGLRGEIRKKEEAEAWNKSAPSLEEYDYYLRGHQLFFRFTKEDNAKARQVWQEGLAKFPGSALLRTKIAFTYMIDIVNEYTDDPWRDTELGWKLAKEAKAIQDKSRLESMLTHWAMAYFYWLHEGDFERAADEAEAAAKLVPNDSWTRADLAQFLTFAGRIHRAIEWLEEAIRRDANPADWYFGALAFAYYNSGRPADAVMQFQKMKQPWKLNLGAAYARAGKLDEAHSIVAQFVKDHPGYTLKDEAVWPTRKQPQFPESILSPYLADLAKAGLPEK